MRLKCILLLCFALSAMKLIAQTPVSEKLTGRIISDSSGLPLQAVNVSLKISKTFAETDANGEFSIRLTAPKDSLMISFVGYRSAVFAVTSAKTKLPGIRLKESFFALESVVINTGYQSIPKERATGSFTFIDNKTLNEQVGTNILDRLNGVATGVLFDNTKAPSDQKQLNFNIRGLSTINGPQDPLIVLDNFPYEGNLGNIDPNTVESITLLKDAAAASIWGTRAGNGVVVITTKKGRLNQPLRVELNSNIQFMPKPDLFSLPQMSSGDYIDVEEFLYGQGFFDNTINGTNYQALTPVVSILNDRDHGLITAEEANRRIDALRTQDVRNDYSKYFYRTTVNQQYALNVSGGSGNMSYMLSGGLDKNVGSLNEGYNRLNLRAENSYRPAKNLLITTGLNYTQSKSASGRPGLNSVMVGFRQVPYMKFADDAGNPLPVAVNYRDDYTDTAGAGYLLNWKYYPLDDNKHNVTTTQIQQILANIGLQYQIANGLSAELKYQYAKQQSAIRNLADTGSYSTRNMINLFSQLDESSGTINRIVPEGSILNLTNNYVESNNLRGQLNFNHTWQNHSLSAILGTENRQTKISNDGNTIYGYDDNLLTVSNVDFVNPYPTYLDGGYEYIGNGLSFSQTRNNFVSYFGNAAYTYQGKYTLSASFRRDASNLFGVNTNDKWNPFWSAGLSYEISKESFYKSALFPYLRVRATYGFSGNVDQTKSAVTVVGNFTSNPTTGLLQAQVEQFSNPDLKWEKLATLNFGLDFSLKGQIVNGAIEYYHKNGTDLFGLVPVDYTTGLNTFLITKNVANMAGNGVDITVQTKNIDRTFKWRTNFLFSYNTSKTTKYFQEQYTWAGILGSGSSISPTVGKPLYAIASYKWGGLDGQGNPQGYVNGKLSTDYSTILSSATSIDSLVYNGPTTPKFFGAIGNSFSWKEFTLTANLIYKLGYYFRKPTISYSGLFYNGQGNADFANRWQKPGDEKTTNIPSMIYPADSYRDQFFQLSEATVEKADNIRLQFISLSYDFQKTNKNKSPFSNIQLYLNISNLGIIWRANGQHLDPDNLSSIQPPRAYAFGVKAIF